MSDKLLFTEDEWNDVSVLVAEQMRLYLQPYRAPIYKHKGDHGEGWGSGSFIQLGERVFILTNEHVAEARHSSPLAYQFLGQEDIRLIIGDHAEDSAPIDLALLPVDMEAWSEPSNRSKAIAIDRLSGYHLPAPTELLAFTGFAGDNVTFVWETLQAEATCSTSRESALPGDDARFDVRFHFGLEYRPDLATRVSGNKDLPRPPGFSGSTVWNTGVIEAKMKGIPWTPQLARVTGVVWGWPSNHGCLVATRGEYLRSFILAALPFAGIKI